MSKIVVNTSHRRRRRRIDTTDRTTSHDACVDDPFSYNDHDSESPVGLTPHILKRKKGIKRKSVITQKKITKSTKKKKYATTTSITEENQQKLLRSMEIAKLESKQMELEHKKQMEVCLRYDSRYT